MDPHEAALRALEGLTPTDSLERWWATRGAWAPASGDPEPSAPLSPAALQRVLGLGAEAAPQLRCPRCKGDRVTFQMRAVRSADEGMVTFYRCQHALCQHEWSLS